MGMTQPTRSDSVPSITPLKIVGMTCEACVRHVTTALAGVTGVSKVAVDLRQHQALVEHLPGGVNLPMLLAAVRDAGYEAQPTDPPSVAGPEVPGAPVPARGCACCTVPSDGR